MKKIAYLSWYPNDASAFYRTAGVFPYINHPDIELTNISTLPNLSSISLLPYDVVIFQRPAENHHLSAIKAAKDAGCKVISDFDDDVLHLDSLNPMVDFLNASKQNIIDSLILSDEVWVGTAECKKAYRLYNNNIYVFPNAHNDYLWSEDPKFEYNKKAMFRGGFSHEGDMYALGIPELVLELVNGNPDWTFYFYGQRFKYLEIRYKYRNWVRNDGASTVQFYKMMHLEHPCAFFYPLATTVFNKGKSSCSWLEATYSGAAYFGNTDLPQFQLPGIKHISEMNHCIDYPEILEDMWQKSWEHIKENYMLSHVNKGRVERLLAI